MKLKILTIVMFLNLIEGYLNLGPFSIFSIIRFPNSECTTSTGRKGICYLLYECEKFGGAATGQCADGYGTCCLMEASCNGEAKTNLTHFISPRYPLATTDSALCDFKVNRTSDICQLRLDMEQFELEGPVNGECDMDVFMVIGTSMNVKVPQLCGKNTGQHLYIDVKHATGPITLRVLIGESNWGRRWSVRVTAIECTSNYKPPQRCHQFYTESSGSILSLGYDEHQNSGSQSYTNNVDYTICFQTLPNTCTVDFEPANNDSFKISRCEAVQIEDNPFESDYFDWNETEPTTTTTTTASTITSVSPAVQEENHNGFCTICEADYLSIFGFDRICGPYFSTKKFASHHEVVKVDTSRPILMNFKSDSNEVDIGFHLKYKQKPCFA